MKSLQPNSRQCFVCGVENPLGLHLKFYDNSPGEVIAECTISDEYQGYPGVVHGGIVAAMLDEVAGRSLMGDMESPRFMYTARLNIKYRRNVPVGKPLRIAGKAGQTRAHAATATSAIYDQEGVLLAEADALLIDIPEHVIESVDPSMLGWQVYLEE